MTMSVGSVTKFTFAIAAAFAAAITGDFVSLLFMLAAVMTAFITWGGSLGEVLKIGKVAVWFFLLIFTLHLFSGSGYILFEIWFLKATIGGAVSGMVYGLKLILFVYSAYIIFFKVDPVELINPIERLTRYTGILGRYISAFLISFSLALRFLPDLSRQAQTMTMAFRSRGFDFKGGLARKARTANLLLISIFVGTFKKAESVSIALELKGYPLRYKKAVFPPIHIGPYEVLVFAISFLLIVGGWISR
jgi:energy-coupling factor transport system permease protein